MTRLIKRYANRKMYDTQASRYVTLDNVAELVRAGDDLRIGRNLLDDILELPQKQLEQLQQRIDAQVRASIDRVTAHPTVQNELRRIESSIKGLERQLGRLRRRGVTEKPPPKRRSTARRK